MVKLRLTRTGRKHEPHYRIVAADSRAPRDGRFIEIVGYYNPRTKPSAITLDKEKAQKWLDTGAQPSDTVRAILVKEGLLKKKEYKPMPIKEEKPEPKAKRSTSSSKTAKKGDGAAKKAKSTSKSK